GVIMGVRHRERPQWGVQFHPESVSSEFGAALIRNFADLTKARTPVSAPIAVRGPVVTAGPAPDRRFRLRHSVIERAIDTEAIFLRRYADSTTAFWLDSEHVEPGLDRFSFLGDAEGPHAEIVSYRVGDGAVTVTDAEGVRTVPGTVLDH